MKIAVSRCMVCAAGKGKVRGRKKKELTSAPGVAIPVAAVSPRRSSQGTGICRT